MPKKNKKATANQIAYKKEQRRIKRFIRSAEKRGYTFESGIVPDMPSRVTTKSLEAIRALRPEQLYKRATYRLTPDVVISGTEGRALERSIASLKAAETVRKRRERQENDIVDNYYQNRPDYSYTQEPESVSYLVYNQVREMIDSWIPMDKWSAWFRGVKEEDKNQLNNMLTGAANSEGITTIARRLEQNADKVIALAQAILYESGGGKKGGLSSNRTEIQRDFVEFATILKGSSLTLAESELFTNMNEADEDNS